MLRYRGGGFLSGIPARDLQESEVESICKARGITRQFLVASGLYVEVTEAQSKKKTQVTHDNDNELVNKEQNK